MQPRSFLAALLARYNYRITSATRGCTSGTVISSVVYLCSSFAHFTWYVKRTLDSHDHCQFLWQNGRFL
jgi:hypothetical protein